MGSWAINQNWLHVSRGDQWKWTCNCRNGICTRWFIDCAQRRGARGRAGEETGQQEPHSMGFLSGCCVAEGVDLPDVAPATTPLGPRMVRNWEVVDSKTTLTWTIATLQSTEDFHRHSHWAIWPVLWITNRYPPALSNSGTKQVRIMLHPLLTKLRLFQFEKQIDLDSNEYLYYYYYLFEAQRNEAKLVNSRA